MCGIHAAISPSAGQVLLTPALEKRLKNRGPDFQGRVTLRLDHTSTLELTFTSTVLSLRGDHIVRQPLVDESSGSVLCWNGDAWKVGGQAVTGNDTEAILTLLSTASRHASTDASSVLDALRKIEGPFAFIYFDKASKRLFYGRDRLGRRSLLVKPGPSFALSSIADTTTCGWIEVEADGIYVLHLGSSEISSEKLAPTRYEWADNRSFVSGIGAFNCAITEGDHHRLSSESDVLRQLRQHLTQSLRVRVLQVPPPPGASPSDARIAVLFSGGLDCTVLARLASDLLPCEQAIDLLNVAFENPRLAAQNKTLTKDDLYELCPDRITARKSFAELSQVCPKRAFRLVTINVPFALTSEHRFEVISLMYPHNTEMDLSIAYALYFAARGEGIYQPSNEARSVSYKTTARVLLSGLGADELFGGYTRHATAFRRQQYQGLAEELKLDMIRLGRRNLGRDDRVMAHWEKETRFPYLDEEFVKWAMELPVWEKCDFANEEIAGETPEPGKRILRLLAEELGMKAVALEKKRAIQFGARTAKLESSKVKGTTLVCP